MQAPQYSTGDGRRGDGGGGGAMGSGEAKSGEEEAGECAGIPKPRKTGTRPHGRRGGGSGSRGSRAGVEAAARGVAGASFSNGHVSKLLAEK